MAKIIKVTKDNVIIQKDDKSYITVNYEDITFRPDVNDIVEVHELDDTIIVNQVKDAGNSAPSSINVNVVNENSSNQVQGQTQSQVQYVNSMDWNRKGNVKKWWYFWLAFVLGGIGIHKFYAKKYLQGFVYLFFSWTYIPLAISFIEAFLTIFKKADPYGNIYV